MILHLYFLFMLLLAGGLLEGCRRLIRRDRIARGVKP
jgi:hypothetical protein